MFKRKSGSKPEKKTKSPKKAAAPKRVKGPSAHVVVQKPDTDVYTVMLIVSFLSVLTGCLLLWLELSRYGSYPWWK